jgi:hypothetical protein
LDAKKMSIIRTEGELPEGGDAGLDSVQRLQGVEFP